MPQHCGETSTKRRATSPVCNAATWVERCRHLNPFAEPAEHYLGHALSSRATHSPRGGPNLQPQSGAGSVSRTETTRLEEKSSRVVFFNCGCAVDNAERASSHSTTWLTVANATPAPRCVRSAARCSAWLWADLCGTNNTARVDPQSR